MSFLCVWLCVFISTLNYFIVMKDDGRWAASCLVHKYGFVAIDYGSCIVLGTVFPEVVDLDFDIRSE